MQRLLRFIFYNILLCIVRGSIFLKTYEYMDSTKELWKLLEDKCMVKDIHESSKNVVKVTWISKSNQRLFFDLLWKSLDF